MSIEQQAAQRKLWGERLRYLRQQRGLSLRRLGKKCGLSSTFLSKIENHGGNLPSAEKIKVIAKELHADPAELLALAGHLDLENIREVLQDTKLHLIGEEQDVAELIARIGRVQLCVLNVLNLREPDRESQDRENELMRLVNGAKVGPVCYKGRRRY